MKSVGYFTFLNTCSIDLLGVDDKPLKAGLYEIKMPNFLIENSAMTILTSFPNSRNLKA